MTLRIPAGRVSRTIILIAALAGVSLLAVACAPLALINSMVPDDTYTVTRDVAYGEEPRQRLDVYAPARPAPAGARLRTAGGTATEISYPALDHRRIVGALAAPLRDLGPVLDDIARFIEAQP